MRLLLISVSVAALLSAGCDDEDDDGADASGNCPCEPPTAADVSYDNATSGLPGDNVQDALDDVAARTDPAADAFSRITRVDKVVTSSAADVFVESVACPGGGLALGGSCSEGVTDQSIAYTKLLDAAFHCAWNNPTNQVGASLTLTVSCLAPPAAN